jgi:hypothetical protein
VCALQWAKAPHLGGSLAPFCSGTMCCCTAAGELTPGAGRKSQNHEMQKDGVDIPSQLPKWLCMTWIMPIIKHGIPYNQQTHTLAHHAQAATEPQTRTLCCQFSIHPLSLSQAVRGVHTRFGLGRATPHAVRALRLIGEAAPKCLENCLFIYWNYAELDKIRRGPLALPVEHVRTRSVSTQRTAYFPAARDNYDHRLAQSRLRP